MYGYSISVPIDFNELLVEYSQEDIFRMIFKQYPDLDALYLSPFRKDEHPNCFFEWYKGKLLFRDFADIRRDCLQAVKDFYGLNTYKDVVTFIVMYFDKNPIPPDYKPINVTKREKRDCAITFRIREYETKDELYWKQYVITKDQLAEDHVSVIYWYRFYSEHNKRWVVLRPYDICYAISGFDTRCKIYRPLNHNKKAKWLTNCHPDDVGNLSNIDPEGELLIITKSYKDYRVIKNQGYHNTIWFQSEMMMPNDQVLQDLALRFKHIIIFYDNDDCGIKGSKEVQSKFLSFGKKVNTIQSPYNYLKDPAEILSVKGEQVLKSFLSNNVLLINQF